MGIFTGVGIGMVLAFVLMVIVGGFFMWIAAKIARVERASFARAVVAAVAVSFVEVLCSALFNVILPGPFGFILGIVVVIFVIKAVFRTSFGQALLVWVFNLIAVGVAVLLASIIMASSLLMSHGI